MTFDLSLYFTNTPLADNGGCLCERIRRHLTFFRTVTLLDSGTPEGWLIETRNLGTYTPVFEIRPSDFVWASSSCFFRLSAFNSFSFFLFCFWMVKVNLFENSSCCSMLAAFFFLISC